MSLMLMGIGVVTLATLFPIAILRSVQATQLTNATILRYNAEAMIDLSPNLVHDPNGNSSFVEHYQAAANRRYVVDPLGWHLIDPGPPPVFRDTFGNDGAGPIGNISRFNGGYVDANANGVFNAGEPSLNAQATAATLATLPDSWVFVVDGFADSANPPTDTSFTFEANVDLSDVTPAPPDVLYRITLFDVSGRLSHVRQIPAGGVAGQTVSWTPALPSGFTAAQARIETQERRYTWLLTVRKQSSGNASVDVVCFFRRTFSPEDETVFSANFQRFGADGQPGAAGVDDDQDGNTDTMPGGQPDPKEIGWVGTDDREVRVTWDPNAPANDPKPFYRKGGYILDAQNARWYRIQDIKNEDLGTASVELVLDQPIIENSTGNGAGIMMRGVIEVFPLGIKALP